MQAAIADEPSSRWCLVVPLWRGELLAVVKGRLQQMLFSECAEAAGLLPDMQRDRHGGDIPLHGHWRVWVRMPPVALAPSATLLDLAPPSKEEVTAREQAVRDAAKWEPIVLKIEAFEQLPFSPEVLQLVREVQVPFLGDRLRWEEIAPYPWKLPEHKQLAVAETERYIACKALVKAADHDVAVSKCSSWVVVVKGGKTRCCLDLSKLVNPWVPSVPFSLPRFCDVRSFVQPGTYLLAYDLRDFFFSLSLRKADWPLFGVRHPGTGELLCCARVPFGYVEAPHVACAVSEGVANELRRRGVECLCFVDDFLLKGGDTVEEALHTARVFEELMEELGFQWAPHKKVGPTQQVVFLGIEIDTRPEHFCFRLPVKKTLAVLAELDRFLLMKSSGVTECEAAELAGLVGRLAFANNVIPGAQLFLRDLYDALSAAFVCYNHGKPWVKWGAKPVAFTVHMWDDVAWWREHLVHRNHWSINPRSHLRGMIRAGTDASTFQGGGQLSLPEGTEELVVEWDKHETKQHINWLECCMVWWLLNTWSTVLYRLLVVFSVDNMVTKCVLNRGSAKAVAMRELVKRTLLLGVHDGWCLDTVHVAGRDHVACDGLSRGECPAEPGVRLHPLIFSWLAAHFRPYQVVIGSERTFAPTAHAWGNGHADTVAGMHSFLHPRYDNVAVCLWWIFKAIHAQPLTTSGLVVLPYMPWARWWSLVSKLRVLVRLPASNAVLQSKNYKHVWGDIRAKHDLVICVFPVVQVEPQLAQVDYVQRCCDAGVRVFLFQVFTEADLGALGVSSTGAIQHGWLWEVVHCSDDRVGITHWNKASAHSQQGRHRLHQQTRPSGKAARLGLTLKVDVYSHPHEDIEAMYDVTLLVDQAEVSSNRVYFDQESFMRAVQLNGNSSISTYAGYQWQGLNSVGSGSPPAAVGVDVPVEPEATPEPAVVAEPALVTSEQLETLDVKKAYRVTKECPVCLREISKGSMVAKRPLPWLAGKTRWVHLECGCVPERHAATQPSGRVGGDSSVAAQQQQQQPIQSPPQHVPSRLIRHAAQYGDMRIDSAMRCLTGCCGVDAPHDMACSSCARVVHSVCLQTRNPFSVVYECPWCLSKRVTVEDPSAELLREMAELSIVDVDGTTDSEAGPVTNLRQAAKRWGELHNVTAQHVLSSPVCFAAMLRHVATRESHPKSVVKHVSAMAKLMEVAPYGWDVRTDVRVKKVVKEFSVSVGAAVTVPVDGVPGEVVHAVIAATDSIKGYDRCNRKLANKLAYLASFRAGEACQTDEAHALHWNGVRWTIDWADLELDDFKFNTLAAIISIIGVSRTGFKFVETLEELAASQGLQVVRGVSHKGEKVDMVDFWCVRISLNGIVLGSPHGEAVMEAINTVLQGLASVRGKWDNVLLKWYKKQARGRVSAGKASRYINVVGGTRGAMDLQLVYVARALQSSLQAQLGLPDSAPEVVALSSLVTVTPGHVLRHVYYGRLTLMPMSYTQFTSHTAQAWKVAAVQMLGEHHGLRLTSQSGRHGGCRDSRQQCMLAKVEERLLRECVNAHHRWAPDGDRMQKYYTGLLPREQRLLPTRYL
jgi:hypothetical protein